MTNKSNKILKAIGTCGVALTLVAPVAAPIIEQAVPVFAAKSARADQTYSITINKRQGSEDQVESTGETSTSTDRNDGVTAPASSQTGLNQNGQPLQGIQYTITKIKATGKVSAMKADDTSTFTTDTTFTASSKITDANGQAAFTGLPEGYYLVHETGQDGIKTGKDFIVSLPMTNKNDGSIIRDVQIWPKNYVDPDDQDLKLNKLVSTDGKEFGKAVNETTGSTLTWDLNAHVPATVVNKTTTPVTYGGFRITDPIVTNFTYVPDSVTVTVDPDGTPITLAAGDFSVSVGDVVDNGAGNDKFTPVTITLTQSGLDKAAGKNITVQLKAKIVSVAVDATGVPLPITNTFNAFADNANTGIPDVAASSDTDADAITGDPTDPKNPLLPADPNKTDTTNPEVNMGRIDLSKFDADTTTTMLENAEFTVYTDSAATTPLVSTVGMTGNFATSTDPNGDGVISADEAGKTVILKTTKDGLSDLVGYANTGNLFLKETKAPTGYLITDEIFPATSAMDTTLDAKVADQKDTFAGQLPITGSQLRIILMTVGSLMMISCGAVLYIRKRKEAEENK